MAPDMADQSLIVDDITLWETEKLIEFYKPGIFCAGIKKIRCSAIGHSAEAVALLQLLHHFSSSNEATIGLASSP